MFGIDLGKYRVIVVSIALFLIFDLGVLVLNFVISSQIAEDAVSVNLAGRQRMLSQRTAKSLLQIEDAMAAGQPATDSMKELRTSFELFDTTFDAFRVGGVVKGGAGGEVALKAVPGQEGQEVLEKAAAVWTPYRAAVKQLLDAKEPTPELLAPAVAAAKASNVKLLGLMNELTTHVEKAASAKATFLRAVQVGGITLATINFLVILFHFVRQLRRNDRELEQAKQETDDILQTVGEGLFLLDRDHRIGTQHSKTLLALFDVPEVAGQNLFQLLARFVPEATLGTARDYVGLLFGDRVNEKLVGSLNPLDVVQLSLPDGAGGLRTKYLRFGFKRVVVEGELAHLLVSVADITKQMELERELAESRERAKREMDLLGEILHLDPAALRDFLGQTRRALEEVNGHLRSPTKSGGGFREKVDAIFRLIHRVKGDAAATGLASIEASAHGIEDVLAALRGRATLAGDDFLPLAVKLEQLLAQMDSLAALLARLASIRESVASEGGEAAAPRSPWEALDTLARKVAERHGKQVELHYQGVDHQRIPPEYRRALVDMMTQLVRNAVAHGIERPDERRLAGKAAVGDLTATLLRTFDGGYELIFRDDGAGISVERIRTKAIQSGRLTEAEAAQWDDRKLMALIFEPAFSTAAMPDADAGRGVGLDLVASTLRRLRGAIRIATQPGRHTEFRITLPAPPAMAQEAAA